MPLAFGHESLFSCTDQGEHTDNATSTFNEIRVNTYKFSIRKQNE